MITMIVVEMQKLIKKKMTMIIKETIYMQIKK